MKKILIFIFVALAVGASVALKMHREGENDIGFMVAMALAMAVAVAIAAPKHFRVLNSTEIKSAHEDEYDLLDGRWKPIRNIVAAMILIVAPIVIYLLGERDIEAIVLGSIVMALVPFSIYWRFQDTKWHFENDKSLYEHQPDLQERFSMPFENTQDKSSTKDD